MLIHFYMMILSIFYASLHNWQVCKFIVRSLVTNLFLAERRVLPMKHNNAAPGCVLQQGENWDTSYQSFLFGEKSEVSPPETMIVI